MRILLLFASAITSFLVNAQITAYPYLEDFESGAGGWSTAGTLWELGTPAGTTIAGAASGTNAWMTGLSTNYPNSAN